VRDVTDWFPWQLHNQASYLKQNNQLAAHQQMGKINTWFAISDLQMALTLSLLVNSAFIITIS
jgi:hypothetical protein